MSAGPIGSEYPGTAVAVAMASFFALLLGRSLLSLLDTDVTKRLGKAIG